MQGFIVRNYRLLATILIALAVILAFLVGYEEGKQVNRSAVVLSCSQDVLSALTVPVSDLAAGDNVSGNTAESAASRGEASGEVGEPAVAGASAEAALGAYVGSKNGTKYYVPSCGTVKRIKPENYIWFKSAEDAKMQGYAEGSC